MTLTDVHQQVFSNYQTTMWDQGGQSGLAAEYIWSTFSHADMALTTSADDIVGTRLGRVLGLDSTKGIRTLLLRASPQPSPSTLIHLRGPGRDAIFESESFRTWEAAALSRVLFIYDSDDPSRTAASIAVRLKPEMRGGSHWAETVSLSSDIADTQPTFYFDFNPWDCRRNSVNSLLSTFLSAVLRTHEYTFEDMEDSLSAWPKTWTLETLFLHVQNFLYGGSLPGYWRITWVLANLPLDLDNFSWLMDKLYLMISESDVRLKIVIVSREELPALLDSKAYEVLSLDAMGLGGDSSSQKPTQELGESAQGDGRLPTSLSISVGGLQRQGLEVRCDEVRRLLIDCPRLFPIADTLSQAFSECGSDIELREVLEDWTRSGVVVQRPTAELDSDLRRLSPLSPVKVFQHLLLPSITRQEVRDQATWALQLLLHALRPLTIHEMEDINEITPREYDAPQIAPRLPVDRYGVCLPFLRGLVKLRHNEVQFGHRSFRRLLIDSISSMSWMQDDEGNVAVGAHARIAEFCLNYLTSSVGRGRVAARQFDLMPGMAVESRLDFASYASMYWPKHFALAQDKASLQWPSLQAFLRNHTDLHAWSNAYFQQSNPVARSASPSVFSIIAEHGLVSMLDLLTDDIYKDLPDAELGCALALQAAGRTGNRALVLKLLDGLRISEGESYEDLLVACLNSDDGNDVVLPVLRRALQQPSRIGKVLEVLQIAAFQGRLEAVKLLAPHVSEEADWYVALRAAGKGGRVEVAKFILDTRPDIARYPLTGGGFDYSMMFGHREFAACFVEGQLRIPEISEGSRGVAVTENNQPTPLAATEILQRRESPHDVGRRIMTSCVESRSPAMVELGITAILSEGLEKEVSDSLLKWGFERATACRMARSCKAMLERYATIFPKEEVKALARSQYQSTAETGIASVFRELLTVGGPCSAEEWTLLWESAYSRGKQCLDLVKLLAQEGAKLWSEEEHRRQLGRGLEQAATDNDPRLAAYLINNGADLETSQDSGGTPLYRAACLGNRRMVKMLVEAGADINSRGKSGGWTPLHGSLLASPEKGLHLLLEKGADINAKNDDGETPLWHAVRHSYNECARALLKHDPRPELDTYVFKATELSLSVFEDDTEMVQLLLEAGADPNRYSANQLAAPLLHRAVWRPNIDIVRLLLAYNIRVDDRDDSGNTALHWLRQQTPVSVVKLVISRGLPANSLNGSKWSPLAGAAIVGNVEVALYYISLGSRGRLPTEIATPLHFACLSGRGGLSMVKTLVEKGGIDVNAHAEGVHGTIFQSAAQRQLDGDADKDVIIRYILDHPDFRLDEASVWWGSNFNMACLCLDLDVVRELIERGASVEKEDRAGRRPIHFALFRTIPIVELLLSHGADVAKPDAMGRVPLHFAVLSGRVDLVRFVLDKKGHPVDQPDCDGWTPLLWALRPVTQWGCEVTERKAVVEALLANGASRLTRADGLDRKWTAYKVARYHGLDEEIVKLVTPTEKELAALESRERGEWMYSIQNDTKTAKDHGGGYCDVCLLVSTVPRIGSATSSARSPSHAENDLYSFVG